MRTVFWTLMCLRPMNFPHAYYFERRDDLGQGNLHEMVDDMSDVVLTCLWTVLDKWEELAEYFDEVLCEKRALFHPAFHDTLLTDDVALSRSKKYFWAIEFLKEMEKSVQDNIRQLDRLSQLLRANPPPAGRSPRDFEARLRKQEGALAKLEALRVRFTQKREEAVALRDGLFNASAVMESRMSTKLGENIKLLTFVSIFFLPLSFCTVSFLVFSQRMGIDIDEKQSLWSVNDEIFSLTALAATMPVLSVLTYVITLRLDVVVSLWNHFDSRMCAPRSEVGGAGSLDRLSPARVVGKRGAWRRPWRGTAKGERREDNPGHLGDVLVHHQVQVDVESCRDDEGSSGGQCPPGKE